MIDTSPEALAKLREYAGRFLHTSELAAKTLALIDALEDARAEGLAARAQYFKDRKGSAKRLDEPAVTNGQQDIHEMVVADLRAQLETAQEALERINRWAQAYPLDVFPEPDLKRARELLEAGGITLDAVSASAMRHVVEGVGKIARAALEGKAAP